MDTLGALPLMLEITKRCLDDPVGFHSLVNFGSPDASWPEVGMNLSEEFGSLLHFSRQEEQ